MYQESHFPATFFATGYDQLLRMMEKGQSFFLEGLPGSGRSTLMRALAFNSDIRKHHFPQSAEPVFVYVDLNQLPEHSPERVYGKIHEALVKALGYELKKGLSDYDLTEEIQSYIQGITAQQKPLVFILRQFEVTKPFPERFFRHLDSWRDGRKDLISFVAIMDDLAEYMREQPMPGLQGAFKSKVVYLPAYDMASLELMLMNQNSAKKLNNDVSARILHLSGGNPRLLKLLSSIAHSHTNFMQLSDEDVAMKPEVHAFLQQIAHYLQSRTGRPVNIEAPTAEDIHMLQEMHLLDEGNQLRLPLLRHIGTDALKTIRIVGGRVYNMREEMVELTAKEFELFSYFYEHADEVVDRERLSTVLSPESEGDGVSNEVIDQYISRLRKKLGTESIETIHGRGYVFHASGKLSEG